jgi:hypothetical protein
MLLLCCSYAGLEHVVLQHLLGMLRSKLPLDETFVLVSAALEHVVLELHGFDKIIRLYVMLLISPG